MPGIQVAVKRASRRSEREARLPGEASSAHKSVVPVVIANPEPEQPARDLYRKCAMMKADTSRPEAARLLKSERRVLRVLLQDFK